MTISRSPDTPQAVSLPLVPARAVVPTPWIAGIAYGVALLACGWILGPLRVLLAAPRMGPFAAVFLEAPLLIAVMILAVRWMDRRNWIGGRRRDRAAMGLIGACLVLVGEGAASFLMVGSRAALNSFVTPTGLAGLALLGVAALAPLILLAWPARRLR